MPYGIYLMIGNVYKYTTEKAKLKREIFPIKNSPNCTTLELFTESFYEKIVDVQNIKIFSLIESFKDIA